MANAETKAIRAAKQVIRTLQSKGYEAFLVGGCVRDLLLGRTPKDCDVTTNAVPEKVQEIFPNTIPVGAKFGVVVVMQDTVQVEVATYRADGNYTDGRRPDAVYYSKTAREDIVRRDFTMNGLLLTPPMDFAMPDVKVGEWELFDGDAIVDFVGGREDIENKLIRAIGDANKRFEEDGLRMLRAVRFAAQLGFEIEEKTLEAIERNAPLLKQISQERVAAELFKMFSAPYPLKGLVPFITTGLYRYCLPDEFATHANLIYMIQRFGMFDANKDPMLGMAMFFSDVGSHADLRLAKHLKLSTEQVQAFVCMNSLILTFRHHLSGVDRLSEASLKRSCRQPGLEYALEIMTQDEVMGKTRLGLEAVMGFVLKVKAYKPEDIRPVPIVTGHDLIDMGLKPGPHFAEILFAVETCQLNGTLTRKDALLLIQKSVYEDDSGKVVVMPSLGAL
jgi:poly(A) polymerase